MARGLSLARRAVSDAVATLSARSVFDTIRRSASITCLRASGDQSRVSAPVTASTTASATSTWNSAPSARSVANVCRIGPGSASPLVSMTMRRNGGSNPRSRSATSRRSVLQVAARDAAGAAVAEQHRRLGAVAHQRIVDADRAELVDDDGGAVSLRALKERTHQGGLPGAEEAGDDGDRNAPPARVFCPAPERPGSAGGEEMERVVHLTPKFKNPSPTRRAHRRGDRPCRPLAARRRRHR